MDDEPFELFADDEIELDLEALEQYEDDGEYDSFEALASFDEAAFEEAFSKQGEPYPHAEHED